MTWIITEIHNFPLSLCAVLYSILCIFSIVTGLMYASGKRKLNPIELSDSFLNRLNDENKLKKFTIKMGWITFIVGIFQGLTALAIFKGYNVYLNTFALVFTLFSICSVIFKLKGKKNTFSIIKLLLYSLVLIVLLLSGINNYAAKEEAKKYLESSDNIKVTKINEGYYFDGPGKENAIIFFPGARVEYISYAPLMYKLSENGYDCFLLHSLLNLSFFNVNTPKNILENYDYEKWYLSGHSLGGVAANLFASNNNDKIYGVISLASYPTKAIPSNIKYFSFYGSEDKVLNMESFEESKKYLPENSKIFVINGGNHSGYAYYGEQKDDGEAKITNDEQQKFIIDTLINRQ